MASVRQALNLYPESRFWRVRGSPSVSNVAGGLATLIVIVLMSAFAVTQLVTTLTRCRNKSSLTNTLAVRQQVPITSLIISNSNYTNYLPNSNQKEVSRLEDQRQNEQHSDGRGLSAAKNRVPEEGYICPPVGASPQRNLPN